MQGVFSKCISSFAAQPGELEQRQQSPKSPRHSQTRLLAKTPRVTDPRSGRNLNTPHGGYSQPPTKAAGY
jgi:hypothetical protein